MANDSGPHPTFSEALRFWIKLGFISFGGPAGQIAIMHTELVERRRWISEARFLHALNYCMLLPGPEATQLATYVGWLLHRTWGGIVAGVLFVLPSACVLWGLSLLYVNYGNLAWVSSIFYGLKPAVASVVAAAVIQIGKRALKNEIMWSIAAIAFVAIFFVGVPFPLVIFSAAIIGLAGGKLCPDRFLVSAGDEPKTDDRGSPVLSDDAAVPSHAHPSLPRSIRLCAISLLLWWTPVVGMGAWLGWNHTLFREGLFFSKTAMVTFGGAYAVLPYVGQKAVEEYSWLTAGQMLDGLGLAETTPGPLIMVLQFVGFLGGWQQPGHLSPLVAATLGAIITTWTTFVPCFLWILLGAPYIERLRGNACLTSALSAVTAAVVGVILNLAVWFGLHAIVPKAKPDWAAATIAVIAFVGMLKWKWGIIPVVCGAGACGLIYKLLV